MSEQYLIINKYLIISFLGPVFFLYMSEIKEKNR